MAKTLGDAVIAVKLDLSEAKKQAQNESKQGDRETQREERRKRRRERRSGGGTAGAAAAGAAGSRLGRTALAGAGVLGLLFTVERLGPTIDAFLSAKGIKGTDFGILREMIDVFRRLGARVQAGGDVLDVARSQAGFGQGDNAAALLPLFTQLRADEAREQQAIRNATSRLTGAGLSRFSPADLDEIKKASIDAVGDAGEELWNLIVPRIKNLIANQLKQMATIHR